MSDHVEIRSGAYADSVTLLQVSRRVAGVGGVAAAQVAMATPLNLDVLAGMGFDVPDGAGPQDLVVAVRLAEPGEAGESDDVVLERALAEVADALAGPGTATAPGRAADEPPRTTGSALRAAPGALVLVSTPGSGAVVEAVDALDAGSDVMVFSDQVPLDQEVALKRRAAAAGRLVMGPDCGTAMVGGVGLGFATVVAPGPVGLVAASGTGCQQLMALLDHAGVGVRHALGVGGRDLSAEVGALSTTEALGRLDADPEVELVVLVSKPPASEVATAVEEYAAGLATPVVPALLGPGRPDLTAVTEEVLRRLGRPVPAWPVLGRAVPARPVDGHAEPGAGDLLRGLFVGGTLCDEAMLLAAAALGEVRSNIPLSPGLGLGPDLAADTHWMVDFGDDAMTAGRAHPMIDPTLRLEHLARAAADPRTGVLLLDVVLGHGAEPDPAALLAPAVREARARGSHQVPVVVTAVGTDLDPQHRGRQVASLVEAGAEVHLSNAGATRRALALLGGDR